MYVDGLAVKLSRVVRDHDSDNHDDDKNGEFNWDFTNSIAFYPFAASKDINIFFPFMS